MACVMTALMWSGGYPGTGPHAYVNSRAREDGRTGRNGRRMSNVSRDGQNQIPDRPFPLGACFSADRGSPAYLDDVKDFDELLDEARTRAREGRRERMQLLRLLGRQPVQRRYGHEMCGRQGAAPREIHGADVAVHVLHHDKKKDANTKQRDQKTTIATPNGKRTHWHHCPA